MSADSPIDAVLASLPRAGVTERPCAVDILRHVAQMESLHFHHVVLHGKGEKADILAQLVNALGMPDTASENFDAFYDCLTDLAPGQIISLDRLPLNETGAIILDIFRDAAAYFAEQDTRFVVLF